MINSLEIIGEVPQLEYRKELIEQGKIYKLKLDKTNALERLSVWLKHGEDSVYENLEILGLLSHEELFPVIKMLLEKKYRVEIFANRFHVKIPNEDIGDDEGLYVRANKIKDALIADGFIVCGL